MTASQTPQDGSRTTPVEVTPDEVKVDLPAQPEPQRTTVTQEPAHPDEDTTDDAPESPPVQ
jgi:hypothetical protein